jgi:hypothetical protein
MNARARHAFVLVLVPTLVASGCGGGTNEGGASSGVAPAQDGGACPAPFAECDGNPGTLCESRLDNDIASCGACGKTCTAAGVHTVAKCAASACVFACEAGFVDCDRIPENGCEVAVGTCGVTTIVATLANAMGLAVDETSVYYGTKGTGPDYHDGILYKVPKGGGQPAVLATGLNRPLHVVVDDTRVYWTNGGDGVLPDGSIESILKTGADRKPITTGAIRPGDPTLAGDLLFWSLREKPLGRIVAARKDGTDVAPKDIVTGIANANGLQLAGTTLVWATSPDDPSITPTVERANLDGSGRMPLGSGIKLPGYQIGVATDAVFVGSSSDGSVRRLPFDLSSPNVLATALGSVQEVRVDGTMVFTTTGSGGRVVAIPPTGGMPIVVADGQVNPSYMTTDEDYVYWTDGALVGPATVRRAKKPGR